MPTMLPAAFRASRRALPIVLLSATLASAGDPATTPAAPYRSPQALRFSPDGTRLAVADRTAAELAIVDLKGQTVTARVPLRGEPSGTIWTTADRILVSESGAGTVAEIDAAAARVVRRLEVGLRPVGLAANAAAGRLVVANSESDSVSVLDLAAGTVRGRVQVTRRPLYVAIAPGGKECVVANALPAGAATDPQTSAVVDVVDLDSLARVAAIRLPPGSVNLREIAVSPDGRWVYVAHTLGRFHVPTTQLDRGWVNTNAFSVIDLPARSLVATLLLDHPMEGAADPWGLVLSANGDTMFVSISGGQQVSRVNLAGLHGFLEGKIPENHRLAQAKSYGPGTENIWIRVQRDRKEVAELVNDLSALYSADLAQRVPVPGKGPRGIDLSPDGSLVAVALYFAGSVALLDASTCKPKATIALGDPRTPDDVRLGEEAFHDATYCFQHWMSCATCHEEGRVDGLNWDLLNDGIGNPKNTRSMLWTHLTPPMMSMGVRSDMPAAVKAGFIHIQFHQPEERTLRLVEAYLTSLVPQPSPRLAGGELSPSARRGRDLFAAEGTACATCHPAPLYTDLRTYDVGTRGEFDRTSEFDTPTMVELWRTAPYLHDGSAANLREVLVDRNKEDKHGKTSHLTPAQIDDLVEFLLSL